jgi:alpha-beta hydrolase superfamily lysophospholipase
MEFLRFIARRWKRLTAVLVAVILCGFLCLNMIAYGHSHRMMHFRKGVDRADAPESMNPLRKLTTLLGGVDVPRPETTLTPEALAPFAQAITIPGCDSLALGAWYATESRQMPLVILFHGYGAEKSSLIPEAKSFLGMGFSVLLMDFRGSGDSSESYTTIGYLEADDVVAAFHFAKTKLNHDRIVFYSQSMGAAAVLRAVATTEVKPEAILVEAVFDRLLHTVNHRFGAMNIPPFPAAEILLFWGGRHFGFDAFDHDPVVYASSVKCPILFLHGSDDSRALLSEARKVFASVPGVKEFKEFPGLGHEAAAKRMPQEWTQAVDAFLRSNLLH